MNDPAIDHLVVAAATLSEGADWVEGRLGSRPVPGGRHDLMGTHNLLLGLGPDAYLEVIAVDPAAPAPGRRRWFGLDDRRGPARLSHWVMRVADLDLALAAAPDGAGTPVALSRGPYRWRFAVTDGGHQPFDDSYPALIEWQGDRHPARDLPDSGLRLAGLAIAHPRADAMAAALPGRVEGLSLVEGAPGISARFLSPGGERRLP